MNDQTPTRWQILRPIVLALWATAAIRLVLDATVPEKAFLFGTFFMTPVVLLVLGPRGALPTLPWKRMASTAFLIGPLVFSVANLVSYGAAAALGWDHGRFDPEGAGPPYGGSPQGTQPVLFVGVPVLAGAVAGGLWSIFWATLVVWIPGKSKRVAAA